MKRNPIGRPGRDENIALDCYLRYLRGQTEAQIGNYYHWKRRRGEHLNLRCVTARRHIRDGKMIYERKRRLAEEAFGIKYEAPVRRRRKKPIDK